MYQIHSGFNFGIISFLGNKSFDKFRNHTDFILDKISDFAFYKFLTTINCQVSITLCLLGIFVCCFSFFSFLLGIILGSASI